ncbi:MAG: hypothetical protein K2X75_04440 [Burkholderiaceae bacterium]|nr:hypothetical protein [Burkholderiaceae bacterium]
MYLTDGGHHYRIDLQAKDGWIVRQVETNEIKTATSIQLVKALQAGELLEIDHSNSDSGTATSEKVSPQMAPCAASMKALEVLAAKKRWIDALYLKGFSEISDTVWIRAAIAQLAKTDLAGVRQFSTSTLRETQKRVRMAAGDWTVVVPRFEDRGGRGKTRTDPHAERIIQETLEAERNRKGPLVRTHVIDSIRARVMEHNQLSPGHPIQMPGASTIDRRISAQFTKHELHVRRSGRDSANRRYRENSYLRDKAQFPLEVSEYDDIDCGTFLIDEKRGLPVGRAFLTHGICAFSAVPLGFDLSYKPRSYDSAIGAICCSLLPKDPERPEFGDLANAWIGYGVQGTILLDNARYNFSRSTNLAAEDARLALAGTRPYGPTEKSSIEHFNHIVKQDFCSNLPGWRGDKSDPDSVKHGVSDSCIDIVAFLAMYVRWVTGVYLNKPGEDGYTPKQRWDKHFKDHSPAVRWTSEQVALLRLRPMELTFRDSGGLKRLGLVYNSDALAALRREIGHKARVLTYVDNTNLKQILVRHPRTHALLNAAYVGDPRYVEGLTAYQQQLIMKLARSRAIKNPGIVEMVRAREELQKMVGQARNSSKLRERKWAERTGNVPPAPKDPNVDPGNTTSTAAPTQMTERVMTDLEWSIVQLEQVELNAEDLQW